MGWLARRQRQPELMDQPGLPPAQHFHALSGLGRINWLSASASTFFRPLLQLQYDLGVDRLRILDVASGGGDVPIRLWQQAARRGLDWRIAGCDISSTAVEYARAAAGRAESLVHFFTHDVMRQSVSGNYDAVTCSLFLHHLDDDEAVSLLTALSRIGDQGPRLILINDLDRSWIGLLLAQVVARLLTRSSVVHVDGPLSVRAAFTPTEALALATQAGLQGATVRRCWPWRWLMQWRRP